MWGSGPFQSIYETTPGPLLSVTLTPEWYLVIVGLVGLTILGILWWPLFLALPLLVLAAGPLVVLSVLSGAHASFPTEPQSPIVRLKLKVLTALLHVVQPLARLGGRLHYGLTPWRRRGIPSCAFPRPRWSARIWSEEWQAPEVRLVAIEAALRAQTAVVLRGGDYDRWDLEVRGGVFGSLRMCLAVEDHGSGTQLVRFRSWPRFSALGLVLTFLFALLATMAIIDQAWFASAILGSIAFLLALHTFRDCAAATASYLHILKQLQIGEE